jgi:hypothetical protein
VLQACVLSLTLCSIHINDNPKTLGVYPWLFADDTCIYTTDRKEGYVFKKLQRGLSTIKTWRQLWRAKRITWRLHIEMTEAKAFRTIIKIYSLFESEHLGTNMKLTLHKALIWSDQ